MELKAKQFTATDTEDGQKFFALFEGVSAENEADVKVQVRISGDERAVRKFIDKNGMPCEAGLDWTLPIKATTQKKLVEKKK